MEAPAVRKGFGPTMPELLGRRWRYVWPVAIALVVVAFAGWMIHRHHGHKGKVEVMVGRGAVQFNFIYTSPPLRPVSANEIRAVRAGLFVQSMAVLPLSIPQYKGDVGSILPIVAERVVAQRAPASRYADVHVTDEGRARINFNPGYYVAWEAKLRPSGRTVFARDYMLVPGSSRPEQDDPHPRRGAIVELLSTHAGGVNATADVGQVGALKKPLRSFRFGTERPH
ncbi:MAG TPA: hypothetical protein VHB30_09000 [Solirubrobacteraceae bacterium]|jgi:hypothetical protein|nr:hypothetical protein [Solirubrobacteraceae bacterium]